jgi:hypothetical protein
MIHRRCSPSLSNDVPSHIERCKSLNLETLSFRNYISLISRFFTTLL